MIIEQLLNEVAEKGYSYTITACCPPSSVQNGYFIQAVYGVHPPNYPPTQYTNIITVYEKSLEEAARKLHTYVFRASEK